MAAKINYIYLWKFIFSYPVNCDNGSLQLCNVKFCTEMDYSHNYQIYMNSSQTWQQHKTERLIFRDYCNDI